MIDFQNLQKSFSSYGAEKSKAVLCNVSFSIREGMITGFLGRNGAGKTTLMKILMGFISQDSGKILFRGKEVTNLAQTGRVGFLPERISFYLNLTGRDFIHYMGSLSGVSKKNLENKMQYWGKKLEIDSAFEAKLFSYSKGMLQRIGLISTLIHDPEVIVLDEPLSGLDPKGRRIFKDVLREIKSEGLTVFFSSHILSDIEEVCDHIIFLKNGRVERDFSTYDFFKKSFNSKYLIYYFDKNDPGEKRVRTSLANMLIDDIGSLKEQNHIIVEIRPEKNLESFFYE